MADAEAIEASSLDLESIVIPLYYTSIKFNIGTPGRIRIFNLSVINRALYR